MTCRSCHLDLRSTTFIKCAECVVPSVELCILCFMGKFDQGLHRFSHSYSVISGEVVNFPSLGGREFGACLSLLDTTRKFSVGSWDEVATRINMGCRENCEKLLLSVYHMWKEACHQQFPEHEIQLAADSLGEAGRNTVEVNPANIPSHHVSDFPGFLQNRFDFDIEYDDSAELILADIEITDEDSHDDVATKLSCLRAFTLRTRRREEVKLFAVTNNLVHPQNQLDSHRCRSREEVDMRCKLRPLQRFLKNNAEFDLLVQHLLNERRLSQRITVIEEAATRTPKEADIPLEAGTVDDSIESREAKDSFGRPLTRSRAASESRRGKNTEEECTKIKDFLLDESSIQTLASGLDPRECELVRQLGAPVDVFALLRDVLLKRAVDSGSDAASIMITRHGETFKYELSS